MKIRISLVLVSLGLFVSLAVFADDCSTADLAADPNSALRKMPVWDQDGTGACYAYAASGLINHYLIKNKGYKSENLLNPIYAAWMDHYKNAFWFNAEPDVDGGHAKNVINAIRDQGFCPHGKVNECLKSFKTMGGNLSDAQLVYYLQTLYDSYTVFTLDNRVSHAIKTARKQFKEDEEIDPNRCVKLENHLKANDLVGVAATSILNDLFDPCPQSMQPEIPKPKTTTGDDQALKKALDRALNSGNVAEISMCSTMLYMPSYRGITDIPYVTRRLTWHNECGHHAVMVTGRKKIGGVCKYMVRNSWGADFNPLDVPCSCILKNGSYSDNCPHYDSSVKEYLGCWYDAKDLLPNTFSVTTL